MVQPIVETLETRLMLASGPNLVQVIDDGGSGFTASGTWTVKSGGNEGDYRVAAATSGNKAVYTFSGLQPGYKYRVSTSYVSASTNSPSANFRVIDVLQDGSKKDAGGEVMDLRVAADDFNANGTMWEDIGSPMLIRGTSLNVEITGTSGQLVADGIRIERIGDWVAPTGAATPSFGINESHWMYSGKTFNYGNGLEPYRDAGNGPYTHYIDNKHAAATDSNNPFGTPDKPRKTVPTNLPAGSVVEIHSGTYGATGTYTWFTGQGTATQPIFIRGADPAAKPTFSRMMLRMAGQYMVVENIKFSEAWLDLYFSSSDPAGKNHHVAFRNNEVTGLPPAYATAFPVNRGHDIVVYNNYIHDNGDPNYGDENDLHGVSALAGAKNIWYVDNHSHGMGGDSIQINSGNVAVANYASNIYIGRNLMHQDGENAVDIKQARDVIISDNIAYGYRPTNFAHSGSDGTAMVVHYNPIDVWMINNEIYDSANGIRSNGSTRGWIVGNVIHDIRHLGSSWNQNDFWAANGGAGIITWSQAELNVVGNTIYNADYGFTSPGGGSMVHNIADNIFADIAGYAVGMPNGTTAGASAFQGNLLYNSNGTAPKIRWGGATYTTIESFKSATGKGAGSIIADPKFVNLAARDVRLADGSPAIDKASNYNRPYATFSSLYGRSIGVDMLGVSRPYGAGLDIGALEKGQASTTTPPPPPPPPDNNAPVVQGTTFSGDEDTPLAGKVTGSDADGDPLTFLVDTQPANGALVLNADGTFTYTPKADYNGTDSFTFRASDGKSPSAAAKVDLTIAPVNDMPVAGDDSVNAVIDNPVEFNVLANDSDVDADVLSVASFTQPSHGTLAAGTAAGSFVYTPAAGFMGSDGFTYTVSDGKGGTATANVAITIGDRAPEVMAVVGVEASSYETGNTPANTIDGNLGTRWSADGDGQWISYDLGDKKMLSAIKIAWLSGDKRVEDFDVLVSDDNANWTTAFSGQSCGTSADLVSFDCGNAAGRYVKIVGHGNTVNTWNSISEVELVGLPFVDPQPTNQVPVAGDDIAETAAGKPVTIDVLANDSDPDGDTLAIASFTQPAGGVVTVDATRGLIYTPNDGFVGADSFSYVVDDGNGGTAEAAVAVNVVAVNNAPTAQADSADTKKDQPVVIDVLANDSDLDGDTLTIAQFTQPANGTVTLESGKLVFTPKTGFVGADSFTYAISDGNGGTAEASVTVNVIDEVVTPPPTEPAKLDISGVTASSAETGNGPANTIDGKMNTRWSADGDGQWIAYDLGAAKDFSQIRIAWHLGNKRVSTFDVQVSSDGKTWTNAYSGKSSGTTAGFETYDLTGATGQFVRIVGHCNTQNTWNSITEVELIGNDAAAPANKAPVANADTAATVEKQPVTIDVLANDSDEDGDAVTLVEVTQPANGSAVIESGKVIYTPAAGFIGDDSFTYTIGDGRGGSSTSQVTVTVAQAPQAEPTLIQPVAVTASSFEKGNPPTNTIDGNLNTRWSADGDGQWISYDLGKAVKLSEIRIAWHAGWRRTSRFDVQVSADGSNWSTVFSGRSSGTTGDLESYDLSNAVGRYVRIVGHGNSENTWNSISEVNILGVSM